METNKEKLTLKELAMAFSNNQKVLYFDDERELSQICRIVELREEEMTISNGDYQYDVSFDDVKLICLPLSDLTKEITHNGETFVPLVKYVESFWEPCPDFDADSLTDYQRAVFMMCTNKEMRHQDDLEFLQEHHFDYQELIEKGLAIDLNTLPND